MKTAIIILVLLILPLAESGRNSNHERPYHTSNTGSGMEVTTQMAEFMEVEWVGIDWNQIEFPIDPNEIQMPGDMKPIATKEDAIRIGKAICMNG